MNTTVIYFFFVLLILDTSTLLIFNDTSILITCLNTLNFYLYSENYIRVFLKSLCIIQDNIINLLKMKKLITVVIYDMNT